MMNSYLPEPYAVLRMAAADELFVACRMALAELTSILPYEDLVKKVDMLIKAIDKATGR